MTASGGSAAGDRGARARQGLAVAALLLLTTVLGAGVRFALPSVMGPQLVDGAHLAQGRLFHDAARRWAHRADDDPQAEGDLVALAELTEDSRVGPLSSALTAVSIAVLGGPRPHAGAWVSALFGTLAIPLVFRIGWRGYNVRAGLYAALLLAVSGWHVMHARVGLAEAPSVFFLLVALGSYLASLDVPAPRSALRCLAAGTAWGMAVAIEGRWVATIAILLFAELYLAWRTRRDPAFTVDVRLARVAAVLTGVAMPIAATALALYVAGAALAAAGTPAVLPSASDFVMGDLLGRIVALPGDWMRGIAPPRLWNFLVAPDLAWRLVGPVGCVLALMGLGACARDRSTRAAVLGLWIVVPVVVYSAAAPVARSFSLLPPVLALLGGIALRDFAPLRRRVFALRSVRDADPRLVGVIAAVILSGLVPCRDVLDHAQSGLAVAAVRFDPDGERMYTTRPLASAYLWGPGAVVTDLPTSLGAVRSALDAGEARYLVIDVVPFLDRSIAVRADPLRGLVAVAESKARPIRAFANPYVAHTGSMFEVNENYWRTVRPGDRMPPPAKTVRIYDLRELLVQLAPEGEYLEPGTRLPEGTLVPETWQGVYDPRSEVP